MTRFPVRAASTARIRFHRAVPQVAKAVIDYTGETGTLAREKRPLEPGAESVDIKIPPHATHIACSIQVDNEPSDNMRFEVECGDSITPIGRHFIVIGAMKAGTTTLFRLLSRHPAICRTWARVPGVGTAKEINYFRSQYQKGHTPVHYDWRFPFDPGLHRWTLDVSPNYTKLWRSRAVPSRIATVGGDVKLAYILRNPVDRIESHIAHALGDGGEVRNIEHCIRVSRYALHLDGYAPHISRSNILLLDFEELRRDPESVMAQICDFLEIEHFSVKPRVHNKRRVKYRLSRAERAKYAAAVRPDVERLIDEYDFKPAEAWLHEPAPWWRGLATLRR